jgi:ATP-dependent RNA helicase RhlB
MPNSYTTERSFLSLDLHPTVLEGIRACGFSHCTAIQARTLPIALARRDLAGQAQTGTGKTAAFLIATFQNLLTQPPAPTRRRNQPRALILAPTRELAIQIHRDAGALGPFTNLSLGLAYGGTDYEAQRSRLQEGVDILIGTPGRIIDYHRQRVFDLRAIQVVVLDEADRMFDLGFIRDIRYLLRRCPKPDRRLGLLFSATLSYRITELAYEHMNDPQLVRVDPKQVTAENVEQSVYYTAVEDKIPLLIGLLRHMDARRSMIFVNTKRVSEDVGACLEANGFTAAVLSSDVPQRKRQHLLARFQRGDLPVLVATDVAARGLHIPNISHVFNFDLPQDAEDYVHRIGRTARLGASGDAISFACDRYAFSLPAIEEFIGFKIPVRQVTDDLLADVTPSRRKARSPHSTDSAGRGPRRRARRKVAGTASKAHPTGSGNRP